MSDIVTAMPGQEPQFVVDVVVPDQGHGFHVSNMKLDELFFEARNAYIDHLGIDDLWHHDVTPQLKELLIRFESEAMPGQPLRSTVQITSRSRRTFVMEQAISVIEDDGSLRPVATCRSVHVSVSRSQGGAVEVEPELWAAIERVEGREIAIEARAS